MAGFYQAMAFGLLLTAAGLSLLGSVATGQGDKDVKISAQGTINLDQERDAWKPLMYTTVNLSEISSIKSTFQLRTFDPEGTVFYGDTKGGVDWFVLSLQDGLPLMQISKGKIHISVAGGPKVNDGKWHTLEVSNQGRFVVLEVDGSKGLVLGMGSTEEEEDLSGELRLALGGILINTNKMIVQYRHHLDGCVRQGNWLNMSLPWEMEVQELRPCYQDVQPGSYFAGAGFAVFNTSAFPFEAEGKISIELSGNFSKMDGTILSIKPLGQERMFSLVANNETKGVTLTFGSETVLMNNTFKRLTIIFQKDSLGLHEYEDSFSSPPSIFPMNPDYWTVWREGHLAFGGLLGEGEDQVGSNFLIGCLEKIQVQGKDVDLDLAFKHHTSISSHSCPA